MSNEIDQERCQVAQGAPAESGASAGKLRRALVQLAQVTVASLAMGACIIGYAYWRSGELDLVWPYLQGERLLFDPIRVVVDSQAGATITERTVQVVNLTSAKVTLIGSQQSCGCIALNEFPIVIRPGEKYALNLKIGVPAEPGSFNHTVKIFSDFSECTTTIITVAGNVH